MADNFIDGVRVDANRSNAASGRSWHIPAKSEFHRPSFVIVILSVVVIAAALIGAITQ